MTRIEPGTVSTLVVPSCWDWLCQRCGRLQPYSGGRTDLDVGAPHGILSVLKLEEEGYGLCFSAFSISNCTSGPGTLNISSLSQTVQNAKQNCRCMKWLMSGMPFS